MTRRSELLVVQGDLTKVAADAFLLPSDHRLRVGRPWRALVRNEASWSQPPPVEGPTRLLTDPGVRWAAPSGGEVLVAVVDVADSWGVSDEGLSRSTAHLQAGLRAGLQLLTEQLEGPAAEAPRRLVAMPLLGTGAGGFANRRGAAIHAILDVLDGYLVEAHADVVLVCRSRSDYAAVQYCRQRRRDRDAHGVPSPRPWTREAEQELDRMVAAAKSGGLSFLFGAGASMPLGLPSWSGLLEQMLAGPAGGGEESSRVAPESLATLDAMDAAAVISRLLPTDTSVSDRIRDCLLDAADRCSVTHALMASLRPAVVVTTNYDQGYEVAVGAVHSDDQEGAEAAGADVTVLPWDVGGPPGAPRVVKLHGDAARGSIVLTRDQFVEMHALRRPLTALLQERLLSGWLVAIGTSLSDATLTQAFAEVQTLRRRTMSEAAGQPHPTAVASFIPTVDDPARSTLLGDLVVCTPAERLLQDGGTDARVTAGELARRVDLLLDEVALRAGAGAGFLADPAYEDLISSSSELMELAQKLRQLAAKTQEISTRAQQGGPVLGDDLLALRRVLASLGAITQ